MTKRKPPKKIITFKRVVAVLTLIVPIIVALIDRDKYE